MPFFKHCPSLPEGRVLRGGHIGDLFSTTEKRSVPGRSTRPSCEIQHRPLFPSLPPCRRGGCFGKGTLEILSGSPCSAWSKEDPCPA